MVPYELLLVHFHGEEDTSQKRDKNGDSSSNELGGVSPKNKFP